MASFRPLFKITPTIAPAFNAEFQKEAFGHGPNTVLSRLQDRGSRGKFDRRLILAPRSPYRPQDKFIYQVLCGESEFRG